eukprot:3212900-Pyramimonas_sp.AAC.1
MAEQGISDQERAEVTLFPCVPLVRAGVPNGLAWRGSSRSELPALRFSRQPFDSRAVISCTCIACGHHAVRSTPRGRTTACLWLRMKIWPSAWDDALEG